MECVYTKENLSCKPIILNADISNEEGFCSSRSFHWRIFPSNVATFKVVFSSSAIMWVVVQKHKLILSIFTILFAHWIGITDMDPPSFPLNAINKYMIYNINHNIRCIIGFWGDSDSLIQILTTWQNTIDFNEYRTRISHLGCADRYSYPEGSTCKFFSAEI